MESWKPVIGYEGLYEVSDLGRVRSLRRYDNGWRGGRVLRLNHSHEDGYVRVSLSSNGTIRSYLVHRLALEAFKGPAPEGQEGCHNDGNQKNNTIDNLRWDYPTSNQADRAKHGTLSVNRGSAHPKATLHEGDVERIRDLLACGVPHNDLAKYLGVNVTTVRNISCGRIWKHVA